MLQLKIRLWQLCSSAYIIIHFVFVEGNQECSMAYGHVYNQTTHLCQCGSYDDCFSGSLTATICLDGKCTCSEDVDNCEDSGHGIGVCVGGSCEDLNGKHIKSLLFI